MRRAVAVRAAFRTKHGVDARRDARGFLRVAASAIHFLDASRVRKSSDARVASGAIQDRVHACLMPRGIHENAFARGRSEFGVRVTVEALRIGIRRVF